MKNRIRILQWSLGIGLVFFFVWQQIQSVRLGYELERTRRTVEVQRERNDYLRLSLERTLSPEWVAQVAKTRLGMQPSSPNNLVILESRNVDIRPQKKGLSLAEAFRARYYARPQTLVSRVFAVSAVR